MGALAAAGATAAPRTSDGADLLGRNSGKDSKDDEQQQLLHGAEDSGAPNPLAQAEASRERRRRRTRTTTQPEGPVRRCSRQGGGDANRTGLRACGWGRGWGDGESSMR